MSLYENQIQAFFKVETIEGTDAVPTAADVIKVSNITFKPLNVETVEGRFIRGWAGRFPRIVTRTSVTFTVEVDMCGYGALGATPTPIAGLDALIRCCGMSMAYAMATGYTYSLIAPQASPSGTLYYFQDGTRHIVTGCRGTWRATGTVNQLGKVNFEFTGVADPSFFSDAPNLSGVSFANWPDPLAINGVNTTGFVLHGLTLGTTANFRVRSFEVGLGNAYALKNNIGDGRGRVLATDRDVTGRATLEWERLASLSRNLIADAANALYTGANAAFSLTHGVAGNQWFISCPTTQLDNPDFSREEGLVYFQTEFGAIPTAANNELQLIIR